MCRPTYAAPMQVQRFHAVGDFLDVAGDFLAAREAEHNLIFGILASLRETPEAYTAPAYLGCVLDDEGHVVAAAIQTPPYRLVLSEMDDLAAIQALASDTVERDLPGVLGPVGTVEAFVTPQRAPAPAPAVVIPAPKPKKEASKPTGPTRCG